MGLPCKTASCFQLGVRFPDGTLQTTAATSSTPTTPAGPSGSIQFNNGGVFGGVTLVPLANGGTNANLSLTGGPSFVLVQASAGAAITVRQLSFSDLAGSIAVTQIASGTVLWSALGNAASNLTLANAGFTTEFDQTSAVPWLWKNTTVATSITTNASPRLELAANYWTGAASAQDTWTLGSSVAAGTNGIPSLIVSHAGSGGTQVVLFNTTRTNINFQNGSGRNFISLQTGNTTLSSDTTISTGILTLQGSNQSGSTGVPSISFSAGGGLYQGTSGTSIMMQSVITFIPTSGTNAFCMFELAETINQTGGANGSSTTLRIKVTETSVIGKANLIECFAGSTGTTEVFAVDNLGAIYVARAAAAAPTSTSGGGTAGTIGQIVRFNGVLYFCSVTGVAGSATWNSLNMTAV